MEVTLKASAGSADPALTNTALSSVVTLPVTPSEVMVSAQQNNTAVRVYGVGESNLKGDVGLRSVTISSFLPARLYNFASGGYQSYQLTPYPDAAMRLDSQRIRDTFVAWFEGNVTLDLVVSEQPYSYGMAARNIARNGGGLVVTGTIESLTYGWKGGTGDIPYTLVFKELRQVERPWQAAANAGATAAKGRTTKPVKTTVVKWKKGDTWAKVVKRVRGSSDGWRKVRKANAAVVNKAKRASPKKKERLALVGYKVKVTAQ